jgi:hypothetical protein
MNRAAAISKIEALGVRRLRFVSGDGEGRVCGKSRMEIRIPMLRKK